ncbi:MAG: dephospho-CoA kinase [Actinomycetota bacterium]
MALTGGIGSGKSTVAMLLARHGAVVVDADAIAREIVEPGQPALEEIARAFGAGVLASDGRLDRPALAALVFSDEGARARLNAITHPRIATRSAELISAAPAGAIVVYDMPLLVEQGVEALQGWDAIVVVDASDEARLARLISRGMIPEDARARMDAQASREQRLKVADHVVDNEGDLPALLEQVDSLWRALTSTDT